MINIMFKIIKNILTFTFIGIAVFSFEGCNQEISASVYKPGRLWRYKVTVLDSVGNLVDSFQLNMKTRTSNVLEKAIRQVTVEYEYLREGKVFDKETTGIEDNSKLVTIHPPRNFYFDIAEIIPFPFITKPFGSGFRSSSFITIQKASFLNRKGNQKINLAGKKINQQIALTGSSIIYVVNQKLKCFVIEGKNLNYINELGQFSGKYFFNEKYGFIKIIYSTPWKMEIIAELNSVDFTSN